jgi:high-affinity nickel-transport protein
MRHATDSDHVLAVTTIVSRYRAMKDAALIGVFWGVGHTLTILVVGSGIILFGWVIPPRLGLSMELGVGVMLVLLGIMTLVSVLRVDVPPADAGTPSETIHSHVHTHGDYIHTHAHGHAPEAHPHAPEQTPVAWLDRHFGRLRGYALARPILVGMVHGLAGSAAVALLVLTTIRDPRWSVLYLLIFGVGTIAGMMMITAAIAVPFAYTTGRFTRLNRGLRLASGVLSLAFGLFLAWEVGVVNGLFTGEANWLPH